jgi:hypothetical protein
MRVEVFGKTGCAKCKSAKEKLSHLLTKADLALAVPLVFHDMDTVEGMAEGAFSDVLHVPTVILRSDAGQVRCRWDGKAPLSTEVMALLGATKSAGAAE